MGQQLSNATIPTLGMLYRIDYVLMNVHMAKSQRSVQHIYMWRIVSRLDVVGL
jgi:hypothetical protein